MTRFIIYLLESGLVLSLIYLGYVVLFRKETYFNFIRIYLICSIILALIIPVIHLNLPEFKVNKNLKKQVDQIHHLKDFYEKLIYWTDVEYTYNEKESLVSKKQPSMLSRNQEKKSLSVSQRLILWIYLSGLTFFFIRFIYLLLWLNSYSKKNPSEKRDGFKLILIKDDIPSFSFFNNVFINSNTLTNEEFKKVFAHEKIHVKQKHTLDLILAQMMSIFQWFNPLVWRLHKSMKIVHEYIADRQVVEQGFGLFDYQSLLLSQLVSIRSVELVNNFNLLSIKKRIAMMNKIKSGMLAKLKAFLALPIIIVVFFVFTDMTITGIQDNKSAEKPGNPVSSNNMSINRPIAEFYQEVSLNDMSFQLVYDGSQLFLNKEKCKLDEFSDVLEKKIKSFEISPKYMQISFDVDINVPMKDLSPIFSALRKNNVLKIVFLVNPSGNNLQNNKTYAHLQKLPPADAEELDKEVLIKKGLGIYEFDEKIPVLKLTDKIENILNGNKDYILEYTYYNNTTYNTFIKYSNSVRVVYQKVRNNYSLKKYNKPFSELDEKIQNEIMFKYPIRLTMKSPDTDL